MKMNGMSAWDSRAIARAVRPLNCGMEKLLETHRFDYVSVNAQPIAFHEIFLLAGRRQHHHRDDLERPIALDLLQHLESVHLGHFQVEKHDDGQYVGARLEFPAPIK